MTAAWMRKGQPLKTLEKQAPICGGGRASEGPRAAGTGLRGLRPTLTCTLGVGGRPWQDDLWEGGKESGPRWRRAYLPSPGEAPHLRLLPLLHGGPGSGQQWGAAGASRSWGQGSCSSTGHSDFQPPPSPWAASDPGLGSPGLTWGAGQRGLSCGLSRQPQEWGPLDGSHGVIRGVQLLARGLRPRMAVGT